jgi:hypothetical protein
MSIALESDIYCPAIDSSGDYIDKIPSFLNLKSGLRCPCLDKVYQTHSSFYAHCKTKTHQSWIETLNFNKANFVLENTKLKELVKSQQLIIAKMEKEVASKNATIAFLSQKLEEKEKTLSTVNNLLEFD